MLAFIIVKSLQSDRLKMIPLRRYQNIHIIREFHTYLEDFKSLAIIVLAGHRVRRNTKIEI